MVYGINIKSGNCHYELFRLYFQRNDILAIRENDTPNYSHSEQLHVFINECLADAGATINNLDAVAVSKGPGSYTGLRIGVSAAKGLCFSLDIPLIAISTLKSMATQIRTNKGELIIPVLDARRMEVYSAVFDSELNQIRDTKAEIIDNNSFKDYSENKTVYIVGNGAEKMKGILNRPNIIFNTGLVPSAKDMVVISQNKFLKNDFEDVAYFEPYYLKDFILQTKTT